MKITVFVAQFPISLSIQYNLESIRNLLKNVKPGDIAIFPEGCVSGYGQDLSFLADVNPDELNAALDELRDLAQKLEIHLWVGSLIPENGFWFNAALGFTPTRETCQYRKINLANHERGTITPGADLPIFDLLLENGPLTVGVQICREIRYPEQWGWLARQGAQVLLHLNNAAEDGDALPVWRSHLVSHAAANQRFVISANNAAPDQIGPTVAISPMGEILDEIVSAQQGYFRAELDLSEVSDWYLDQCRRDVVAIDVPSQKERRQIARTMRMTKLKADLDQIEANPDLFEAHNFRARTEALNFALMIDNLIQVRSRDRELKQLHERCEILRQKIEATNAQIFTQLRTKIQTGAYDHHQLKTDFHNFTDYQPGTPPRAHFGYEELDSLVSGIFFSEPAPDETLEREYGMVRYQPTPASVILEMLDRVPLTKEDGSLGTGGVGSICGGVLRASPVKHPHISPSPRKIPKSQEDVFFDLGSGLGQVIGLVNVLTGVPCVGIEYQPSYCEYARQMSADLNLKDVRFINSDVRKANLAAGTVFFLFNPFGGVIFDAVLAQLRQVAEHHEITICSYGASTTPLSELPWLQIVDLETNHEFKLAIFKSKIE